MFNIEYSSQFKKDFKRVRKLAITDLKEVFFVISALEHAQPLAQKYKDHNLTGNWSSFKECHIKPDLLLIYRIDNKTLQLARIGSHSELF